MAFYDFGAKRAESALSDQGSLIKRLLPFGRRDACEIVPFLQASHESRARILNQDTAGHRGSVGRVGQEPCDDALQSLRMQKGIGVDTNDNLVGDMLQAFVQSECFAAVIGLDDIEVAHPKRLKQVDGVVV